MNASGHITRRAVHIPSSSQDTELAAAAVNAIGFLTTVPVDWIKVKAQNGWLLLEGDVNSDSERIIVEEIVRPLGGVRGVTNSIKVRAFPCCPV